MNSEEYERRKRLLDEQLLADLELIQAGHAARLRALDALRDGSRRETLASGETQDDAAPARRSNVLQEILDAFPQLPEVFDKSDVVRALGYVPHRATLHRAWDRLLAERKMVMDHPSDGLRPTRYRKMPVNPQGG